MVGVHLGPREDLSYFLFCKLQVRMGVYYVQGILIADDCRQDWVIAVGGAFSHYAVSELTFVSFLLNVDRLIRLVQKCLSVAKKSVRHWLLSDRAFAALCLGVKRKVTTVYHGYRIENRTAFTLPGVVHSRERCGLPARYVPI